MNDPKPTHVQLEHEQFVPAHTALRLSLVLPDLSVPMNVGGLFRLADAMGIEAIYLTGSTPKPPNPKTRKMARSAERFVRWSHFADPLKAIARLRESGHTIVALEQTSHSCDLRALRLSPGAPLALVVGSEKFGVPQVLLDAADFVVHVPMFGRNSSMNVVTACAIAVFEIHRQTSETEPDDS